MTKAQEERVLVGYTRPDSKGREFALLSAQVGELSAEEKAKPAHMQRYPVLASRDEAEKMGYRPGPDGRWRRHVPQSSLQPV